MATLYVATVIIAAGLMAINCVIPALILAGVAAALVFRKELLTAAGYFAGLRAPSMSETMPESTVSPPQF